MKSGSAPLTDSAVEAIARVFRLLGEPIRLRILQSLETGEHNVTDLVEALGAGQPNISRHLNALYEAGLVARRRQGSNIYYSIGDPMVFKLCELVCGSAREQVRIRLNAFDKPKGDAPDHDALTATGEKRMSGGGAS